MKIGVFFRPFIYSTCGREDVWLTSRAEGRSMINQAHGLALMGHEVDLFGFPDEKDVMPGLSYLGHYDENVYYDVLCNLPEGHASRNYGRMLWMIEPSNAIPHLKKKYDFFPRTTLYTVSSKAISYLAKNGLPGVEYFPFLFPIPCLPGIEEQDFLPFKLDIKKDKVKIWVFINSWPNYHLICDKEILTILRRLRDHHKLNLEVSILQASRDSKFNTVPKETAIICREFDTKIMYSNEMCYIDIINSLQSSDMCITKGGFAYCGNCSYDIVSLGKLMIYVTEGNPSTFEPQYHNVNDLLPITDYVISTADNLDTLNSKLDRIMFEPEACHGALKKALDTYRFPVWKDVVELMLKRITED